MSTYAIGDVQGCFSALQRLLTKINFDPAKDTLWFTGDVVNRGPESLETLRFVKSLGKRHLCVLGNHDLHLLAVAFGAHPGSPSDTLDDILAASDRDELLEWLCHLPFIHHDNILHYSMVHAGLANNWDIPKALALAEEVQTILRQPLERAALFSNMYGNQPAQWTDALTGWDRIRCIINFFTRVRFCYPDGRMDLDFKGDIQSHPQQLTPWFKLSERKTQHEKIIFGHWAALMGVTDTPNTYALDTGCVWGNCLTAMRLEDEQRFSLDC